MHGKSDIPFGKWWMPEYGGRFLKLESWRSEKGLSKLWTDGPTFHPKPEVLQVINILT